MWHAPRRLLAWCWWLCTVFLIAACATPALPEGQFDTQTNQWSGRLGLTVASEPPESFSAGFELSGSPDAGELTLTSPLGSTLAVMQWRPGGAWLRQGEQARRYESLDTLVAQVTGAPLPVRALFGWLRGQPQSVPGWQADLSRLPEGRLTAQRQMPLPTAELRVVLDR